MHDHDIPKAGQTRICEACGQPFVVKPSTRGRYCSRQCGGQINRTGEKHLHPSGYVRFSANGSGWIWEHRWVMEQYLGRPLRKGEHIHHRNGDKADNRIENLEIVDPAQHRRIHQAGKRLPTWARLFDRCQNCGTTEVPHRGIGLCGVCYMRHWKERR